MMQHRNFNGTLIAECRGMSFEERERAERLEELEKIARIIHADSPWFALRVMTGREISVKTALDDLGITALVPQRKGPDYRRRHRIIPGTMQPVIYGYVLVQSDPHPAVLVAFKAVQDVLGVLGGAEKPMRVTASEISRFKGMADAGLYDWEKPCSLIVKAGDKVRIAAGPFEGIGAVVVTPNAKGKGDVVVSVGLLGGDVPMTLPLAMLENV